MFVTSVCVFVMCLLLLFNIIQKNFAYSITYIYIYIKINNHVICKRFVLYGNRTIRSLDNSRRTIRDRQFATGQLATWTIRYLDNWGHVQFTTDNSLPRTIRYGQFATKDFSLRTIRYNSREVCAVTCYSTKLRNLHRFKK
jgi:hypothetical protein